MNPCPSDFTNDTLVVKPGLELDPGVPLRVYYCSKNVEKPNSELSVEANMPSGKQISYSREWLHKEQGVWSTDLQLVEAGEWIIRQGQLQPLSIHVKATKPLNFTKEFGVFSLGVVILLIGMVLWLRYQKAQSI